MDIYQKRRAELYTWMARNSIALVVLEDSEAKRNPSIRYLSGHPSDAIFLMTITGHSILCPWDINIAEQMAYSDVIEPFENYDRQAIKAVKEIAKKIGIPENSKIEIPETTPYPMFLKYVDALAGYDVLCRENGVEKEISKMRSIKDDDEIEIILKACEITNSIIDKIERQVKNGRIKTETDVAIFIEKEARLANAEGTGFETLVAGPKRSFGIHAFPSYTANEFPAEGLSILDFGIKYKGYTSDVTITFAMGNLSDEQETQLSLVEKAYNIALDFYKPGTPTRTASKKVNDFFKKAKRTMPHSLGHGIGLEVHEMPFIRDSKENKSVFEPGMIASLEPGLYHPEIGGCRLENTILITEEGNKSLTNSRIIRL